MQIAADRLIDQHGVRQLVMIAESFAMIGHHEDHRVLVPAGGPERVEHAANLCVGERNLAIVGTSGKLLTVRRRRIVGRVRIVEVHPQEEARVPLRIETETAAARAIYTRIVEKPARAAGWQPRREDKGRDGRRGDG